jgi:hypothetical protein
VAGLRIGFTGTREGLTERQLSAFRVRTEDLKQFAELHHGACVGADAGAVWLAWYTHERWGWPKIIAHPSDLPGLTDPEAIAHSHVVLPAKPPLERNRDIVDDCDMLLACPKGMAEERRSGTWSTVRYARKAGKPIVLFWPDGKVTQEGEVQAGVQANPADPEKPRKS